MSVLRPVEWPFLSEHGIYGSHCTLFGDSRGFEPVDDKQPTIEGVSMHLRPRYWSLKGRPERTFKEFELKYFHKGKPRTAYFFDVTTAATFHYKLKNGSLSLGPYDPPTCLPLPENAGASGDDIDGVDRAKQLADQPKQPLLDLRTPGQSDDDITTSASAIQATDGDATAADNAPCATVVAPAVQQLNISKQRVDVARRQPVSGHQLLSYHTSRRGSTGNITVAADGLLGGGLAETSARSQHGVLPLIAGPDMLPGSSVLSGSTATGSPRVQSHTSSGPVPSAAAICRDSALVSRDLAADPASTATQSAAAPAAGPSAHMCCPTAAMASGAHFATSTPFLAAEPAAAGEEVCLDGAQLLLQAKYGPTAANTAQQQRTWWPAAHEAPALSGTFTTVAATSGAFPMAPAAAAAPAAGTGTAAIVHEQTAWHAPGNSSLAQWSSSSYADNVMRPGTGISPAASDTVDDSEAQPAVEPPLAASNPSSVLPPPGGSADVLYHLPVGGLSAARATGFSLGAMTGAPAAAARLMGQLAAAGGGAFQPVGAQAAGFSAARHAKVAWQGAWGLGGGLGQVVGPANAAAGQGGSGSLLAAPGAFAAPAVAQGLGGFGLHNSGGMASAAVPYAASVPALLPYSTLEQAIAAAAAYTSYLDLPQQHGFAGCGFQTVDFSNLQQPAAATQVVLGCELARGGYGKVYSAVAADGTVLQDSVLKVYHSQYAMWADKDAFTEMGFLAELQGIPGILQSRGCGFLAPGSSCSMELQQLLHRRPVWCVQLERMDQSLGCFVQQAGGLNVLATLEVLLMLLDIFCTLHLKLGKVYVHRDMKLENVMMKNKRLYLSDFGTMGSRPHGSSDKFQTLCGTDECMSPELLHMWDAELARGRGHLVPALIQGYDETVDVYACLAASLHMLCGSCAPMDCLLSRSFRCQHERAEHVVEQLTRLMHGAVLPFGPMNAANFAYYQRLLQTLIPAMVGIGRPRASAAEMVPIVQDLLAYYRQWQASGVVM